MEVARSPVTVCRGLVSLVDMQWSAITFKPAASHCVCCNALWHHLTTAQGMNTWPKRLQGLDVVSLESRWSLCHVVEQHLSSWGCCHRRVFWVYSKTDLTELRYFVLKPQQTRQWQMQPCVCLCNARTEKQKELHKVCVNTAVPPGCQCFSLHLAVSVS